METSCTGYAYAPLLDVLGCHVVGTDAMTGIQARERAAPTKPLRPGRPERREHAYIRHGTTTRSANCNVATGTVFAPSLGPTRTAADCADHIARTIATDPDASWRFLADNRNTQQSATLVRLVATQCGLPRDLRVQGQSGVLQSMPTRAACLSDPAHAHRLAQPDRAVVQHPHPPGAPARRSRRARRPPAAPPRLHRLFQPQRQTLQVDLPGPSALPLTRHASPPGCTSGSVVMHVAIVQRWCDTVRVDPYCWSG